MSARVETSPMRAHISGTVAVAIVAALGIGVLTGSLATRAFTDPADAASAAVVAPLWDTQKVEAMEGRVLAEQFRSDPVLWDAGKLEAMEGRVLATLVGEGHAPTSAKPASTMSPPHVPKRAPGE